MEKVRIVDVTPPGNRTGKRIWQLKRRIGDGWHASSEGDDTSADRDALVQRAREVDPDFER